MVLDAHRHRADPYLDPLARNLHEQGVKPDHLTWASLLFASCAGAMFYVSPVRPELLVVGAVFVFLNAAMDGLDGKLARRAGYASPKGDYLDHTIDRFSDVLILGSLALSPWATPWIGFLAVVAVLLTSYLGTQAQAAGLGRDLGGFLGRADRLALLTITPVIQYLLIAAALAPPYVLPLGPLVLASFMDGVLLYVAIVGTLTVVSRFWRGLRQFRTLPTGP